MTDMMKLLDERNNLEDIDNPEAVPTDMANQEILPTDMVEPGSQNIQRSDMMRLLEERKALRDSEASNSYGARLLDAAGRFANVGTGREYQQTSASQMYADAASRDRGSLGELGKAIAGEKSHKDKMEQIKLGLKAKKKSFEYKDSKFVSESGDPVIQTGPQEYSVNGKPYTGKLIKATTGAAKGYQDGKAITEDGRALIFDPGSADYILAGSKEPYTGKVFYIKSNTNSIRRDKLSESIDENVRKKDRSDKSFEIREQDQDDRQTQYAVKSRKGHGKDFDSATKNVVKVFESMETVMEMLDDPNRLTSQAIQSILPRMAGDVGALSDSDRKVWASFPGALNWIRSMAKKIVDNSTTDDQGNIIYSNKTTLTDGEIQQLRKIVVQLGSKKKEMYESMRNQYADRIVRDTDDGRSKDEQRVDALGYLGKAYKSEKRGSEGKAAAPAPKGKVKVTNGKKVLLIKEENLQGAIDSGFKLID